MIEDINAQAHVLVDNLNFEAGTIALSALRSIDDSQSHAGPFTRLLGLTFHEVGDGRCTASLKIKHHLLNPLGIAHGGVAFSLADSASGGAALSALGEPRIVTQDMQIRYHGPARSGIILAEAEVLHHGQRTITTSCRVSQNDTLIASVTATFAILSKQEIGLIGGNAVK
ncbi:MAG TPA: PaaI family thioesterase [candidate division Zixibacteria bacterium]|nr:PaaI family thioesterase [candidate division Zixibacteria bacterium]